MAVSTRYYSLYCGRPNTWKREILERIREKKQRTEVNSTLVVNNNQQINPNGHLIPYATISIFAVLIFTPSCPTLSTFVLGLFFPLTNQRCTDMQNRRTWLFTEFKYRSLLTTRRQTKTLDLKCPLSILWNINKGTKRSN